MNAFRFGHLPADCRPVPRITSSPSRRARMAARAPRESAIGAANGAGMQRPDLETSPITRRPQESAVLAVFGPRTRL